MAESEFLSELFQQSRWDFCAGRNAVSDCIELEPMFIYSRHDGIEHGRHTVENGTTLFDKSPRNCIGVEVSACVGYRRSMCDCCQKTGTKSEAMEQRRWTANDVLRDQVQAVAYEPCVVDQITFPN